jgi:hypothetical protein
MGIPISSQQAVNPDPFNHDIEVEQLLEEFKNTNDME